MTAGQLTRDQADVLAAYGWAAADILLTPEQGIPDARAAVASRSGGGWHRPVWNWSTTERGIVAWRTPGPERPDVVLTWSLLRASARALPDRERHTLDRARRTLRREIGRTVAPYLAGSYAAFVQPPPQWRRDAQLGLELALAAACDALAPADELALFEVSA
jgi:hypothetical protein